MKKLKISSFIALSVAVILFSAQLASSASFKFLTLESGLVPAMMGDNNDSSSNDIGPGFTIDGATDQIETIIQAPASDTITTLFVAYNSRSAGTPVAHSIALQGVTTSTGRANGTVLCSSAATGAFTPPANGTWDGTGQWITIGSCAVTQGDYIAIVIKPTGTPTGGNAGSFNYAFRNNTRKAQLPYVYTVNAGTGTAQGQTPVWGMRSATATYGMPFFSASCTSFSSGSSPNEYALNFTVSNPTTGTFQIAGIKMVGRWPITAKTASVNLYDTASTTVLRTTTIYGDVKGSQGNSTGDAYRSTIYFPGLDNLNYGTPYRISLKALDTTSAVCVMKGTVTTANDLSAIGGGAAMSLSTRAGGSWTDDTVSRPAIDLIIADSTPPSGGGIVGAPAGLNGGMQQ